MKSVSKTIALGQDLEGDELSEVDQVHDSPMERSVVASGIDIESWVSAERHSSQQPGTWNPERDNYVSITNDDYIASHLAGEVSRTHIKDPKPSLHDEDVVMDRDFAFQRYSTTPHSRVYAMSSPTSHASLTAGSQGPGPETNAATAMNFESRRVVVRDLSEASVTPQPPENSFDMIFQYGDQSDEVQQPGSMRSESLILQLSRSNSPLIHDSNESSAITEVKYLDDQDNSQLGTIGKLAKVVPDVQDGDDNLIEIEPPARQNLDAEVLDDDIPVAIDATVYDKSLRKAREKVFEFQTPINIDRQLRFAAKMGDADAVLALLQRGANVNKLWKSRLTALDLAAYEGHMQILEILISHGAIMERIPRQMEFRLDGHNQTIYHPLPLHLAALRGHVDAACFLAQLCDYPNDGSDVDGSDEDDSDEDDFNFLEWAVNHSLVGLTRSLLKHNYVRSRFLSSDLILVAAKNGQEEILQVLLEYGAEMSVPEELVTLALIEAIVHRDKRTSELLLRHGADPSLLVNFLDWPDCECRCTDCGRLVGTGHVECSHKTGFCKDDDEDLSYLSHLRFLEHILFEGHENNVNDMVQVGQKILMLYAAGTGYHQKVTQLIKAGAEVNIRDIDGNSPLHLAVDSNCAKGVTELLYAGAIVNVTNHQGDSPLLMAVERYSRDIVTSLVNAGADVNLIDRSGKSPLLMAVERNCEGIVTSLVNAGADVNFIDKSGRSLLYLAVERNDHDIVTSLIEAGANLDFTDEEGKSLLYLAVEGDFQDIVTSLINSGANANFTNKKGESPLLLAVKRNSLDVTMSLINSGANINFIDSKGKSLAHLAVKNGFIRLLTKLLGAKLSPNILDYSGKSPLHLAVEHRSIEAVTELLKAGALTNITDRDGNSPLHSAVRYSFMEALTQLLRTGASASLTNQDDERPIHLALKCANLEAATLLLDADTTVDRYGDSLLHSAIRLGSRECVTKLINAGASVNTINKCGDSPLHLAVSKGSEEIVAALVSAGADVHLRSRNGQGDSALSAAAWGGRATIVKLLLRCKT